MNNSISHRGPDDAGIFFDPQRRVGLAHRRLSIIDLSDAGHQPMWSADGRVAIVYNGELYNYKQKRAELIADGFTFRSESDTEVLLNLYKRDGAQLLNQLNGMFAFAIWDQSKATMLLARDALGIKPLYWANTAAGFIFASELKAILQSQSVPRDIDPEAVRAYLTYLWCPSPRTMLRSVRKLEPGQALLLRDGAIRKQWFYYDIPYAAQPQHYSADQAAREVRGALQNAVKRQLVADVEVGAFLSGGLDSSSIVALYRQLAPDRRIQCFTIDFGSGGDSSFEGFSADLPYAQAVAEHLDVQLHRVLAGPEMIDRLPQMIYMLDEPQADPAPLNAWLISELARQRGIKVLLSGAGGDDLFTGYRRHYALTLERLWRWLPPATRRSGSNLARRLHTSRPLARRIRKAFQYAHLERDQRLTSYFFWLPPSLTRELLSEDIRSALRNSHPAASLCRTLERLPRGVHDLNRMLYLEAKHFLPDHNLNYTDKMSMAAGVEVRVPFLDPDLVEIATRIPVRYKQRGASGKWILKQAMAPYLPDEIINRPKSGFGAPLRAWLSRDLRALKDELLHPKSLRRRGLFAPDQVLHLIRRDAAHQIDATYPIFAMMCIELWCRTFVDQDIPAPIELSP